MINAKIISPIIELNPSITKDKILNRIYEEAKAAHAMNASSFLLYYSGHGNKQGGAWKCSVKDNGIAFDRDEYLIEIEEVIQCIVKSGFNQSVEITSDSCYSGQLCYKAQELWMSDLLSVQNGNKPVIT